MKWKDLSISKKLYLIVGLMAFLLAGELLVLHFAMQTISAVRAVVMGESLWSKGQKNALVALQRYGITRDESNYSRFLGELGVLEGDRRARVEFLKDYPDLGRISEGFIAGGIHPEDVDSIVRLMRRFHRVSYVRSALQAWTRGDELVLRLGETGDAYRRALLQGPKGAKDAALALAQLASLNDELTRTEAEFSETMSEGSRWMERALMILLSLVVLTTGIVGLLLSVATGRSISRGLDRLALASHRIGMGDFETPLVVHSSDEIGELTKSILRMRELLEASYRELEDRVHERTAALESALAHRDEFLSIASHELRTPLSALLLQLELISRKLSRIKGTEDQVALRSLQGLAERCIAQARRFSLLIDQLMDLTLIQIGKLQVNRKNFDLTALLCDTVEQFAVEAERAGSSIHLDCSCSVIGSFDAMRISQVLTNLLSNALKYGNGRPVRISLQAEGNQVAIRVQDQGVGISPEEQKKLFQRFTRAGQGHHVKGLGLGLYITSQIVAAHGGTISVQSALEEGSVFTVLLPC